MGDGARRFPFGAAACWAADCEAFRALLGEGGPRWELRGEFLGEFLGEAPGLGEGVRLRGEPRNEGRVLGETDRSPRDEGDFERGLDGVRDR